MDFDEIKNNSIIVVSEDMRDVLLKNILKLNRFYNIKIMTFDQLKKGIFFSYDERAINYIMNHYNVNTSVAITYLESIYYIKENDNNSKRIDLLNEIYNKLNEENLIIYDDLFIPLLKSKEQLIVYGFNNLNKYQNYILNKIKDFISINIIDLKSNDYDHTIFEFNTIDKEIAFVAENIANLIYNKTPLTKIYIANINNDYNRVIRRIFNYYNIPITLKSNEFLSNTELGKYFIKNIDLDKEKLLNEIKDKYDNNSLGVKSLINFINKFYWLDKLSDNKKLVLDLFKTIKLKYKKNKHEINICDIKDHVFNDDDYVFLINFNLNQIPKIKKDEDYITDEIKPYYLDTSDEVNELEKNSLINSIKNIKNLTITYKTFDTNGICEISNLNNYLNYNVNNLDNNISHFSNRINKINLASLIDYEKLYNQHHPDLDTLLNNYTIDYNNYENRFTGVENSKLINYIKNNLSFSYSNINTYYSCPFKFYNNDILKINNKEQNFKGFIGSLSHFVLENKQEKDVYTLADDFIKNNHYELNNKEKFYIKMRIEDLKTIIEVINEQMIHASIDKEETEKEIIINLKNKIDVTIKGFIDKILIKDNKILIIDYKTNSTIIDPSLFPYGLNMQLPIYLYLMKKQNENYKIAGLFIQHLFSKTGENDKESLLREMKLIGLINNDKEIIKDFDDTYEKSEVIKNLSIDKDTGEIKENQFTYSDDDFKDLYKNTEIILQKAITNVLDGLFEIKPINIEKKVDACQFCEYKDVCFKKYKDIMRIQLEEENNNG